MNNEEHDHGLNLVIQLLKNGFSQADLARELYVSTTTVNRWLKGHSQMLRSSYEGLRRLADAKKIKVKK